MNDFKVIIEGTRASNHLPTGVNWNFYNSYPKFRKAVSARQNHVLKLLSDLLKNQKIHGNFKDREAFELVAEGNETILERVNHNIDFLNGTFKNNDLSVIPKMWKSNENSQVPNEKKILVHARNIERPQMKFKIKVDNRPVPFKPRLNCKPNCKIPLNLCLETDENGIMFYKHPYQFELEDFKISEEHLGITKAIKPASLENTKFVEANTEELFNLMVSDLRSVKELAVDLEAHSYRTYQGLTCLMQISTRNADYIIDTLELRDKMQILNEIFTDPTVVKVFHGADSDILWLQRDLGLYIVNMFDTYRAAKILNFSKKGLDFLLKRYCEVDADKKFQLYDWRSRPLSSEAIHYARCDTHYLLYIYDLIKKELMEKSTKQCNYIELVFQQSTDVCKLRYEVNMLCDESHLSILKRSKKNFGIQEMYALKHIYAWRDKLARELDESPGYVLPNHMLLEISKKLPKESSGILACCVPTPPLVRQYLHNIHHIVKEAKEHTFENAENDDKENSSYLDVRHIDFDLISLHDFSKSKNKEVPLPTLLNNLSELIDEELDVAHIKPQEITIFQEMTKKSMKFIGLTNVIYKQPYELYLKTIEYQNILKKTEVKKEEDINSNQPLNTSTPMECPDTLYLEPQIQKIKKEIIEPTNATQEIPTCIVKTENVEEVQISSTSSNPTNIVQQNSSSKNSDFKPHNYQNTDFTKYHNQSKDVLCIAKRLQQKKNKSKKKKKPKRLQKTV